MASQSPFSLRIFVPDGDPDGLRLVERSNWDGMAVMFPRSLYPQIRIRPQEEVHRPGIYLLIGPRAEGDGEMLYIGEGDPVRDRLDAHYKEKDFWTRAVFFVGGPKRLNKAHVQYLESLLVNLAKNAKRMPLENVNTPSEPTLSEADRADMDVFLSNVLGMLPVLGIQAFERSPKLEIKDDVRLLTCQGKGVMATGYDTSQGFVVRSGSVAVAEDTPALKIHLPAISHLRADLIKSGVLVAEGNKLRFTQDYTFSSPSSAADVIFAHSTNGRTAWKDASGRTLKELQEAQAES